MTAYRTATVGRLTRPISTFARAEHQLDRFISDNYWSTYMIVCGSAFAVLGVIAILSVV